ncbi:MAG TPA: MarR family transcriptional regulator [Candidatus Xenobia bacterium]
MGSRYAGTAQEVQALNAFINLIRASESLTSRLATPLAQSGLTTSQFGVLESLYHLGPMCQGDIAQKILKSTGNITMVVDNLEKRSLVERRREGDDRRFVTVRLTRQGEALIGSILPQHIERVMQAMSALTPAEQEQLRALSRKLGRAVAAAP